MTAALATLNPAALVTLADCEQRIERGLKSFIDVGEALATIHNGYLYRATHTTFEDYCRERWNLSRPRAYELMAAADVVSGMPDTEVQISNARQANALSAVPEAERAEVWDAAVERTNGKPTAKAISEVVKARTQSPGPVDAAATPPAGPGATPEPGDVPSTAPSGSGLTPPSAPTEALIASVLEALDGHGQYGRSIAETWLKIPGVHSSVIQPAVDELVRRGRVVAGPVIRGIPRWLLTPEPITGFPPAASDPGEAVAPREDGATAAPPTLRLDPTADEKRAAVQRDARGLLLRVVEILDPAHDRAGFVETWARQLGPYDEELSALIHRAHNAMASLDDLISEAGK